MVEGFMADAEEAAKVVAVIEANQAKMAALRAECQAELAELLSEEQLAKLCPEGGKRGRCGRGGRGRGGRGGCDDKRGRRRGMHGGMRDKMGWIVKELEMTEEQQASAKAIFGEVMAEMTEEMTLAEKKALFETAMQRVHDEVLTEAQQAKADEMRAKFEASPMGKLFDLSDEQLALCETIKAEVMAAVEAAETREAKAEAMKAGWQRFRDEVLTEEQQASFDAMAAKFQRGGRGGHWEDKAEGCEQAPAEEKSDCDMPAE